MWEEELRLSTRGWSLIEGQFHGAKMKINVEETVWVIGYLNLRSDRDRYIRKGDNNYWFQGSITKANLT